MPGTTIYLPIQTQAHPHMNLAEAHTIHPLLLVHFCVKIGILRRKYCKYQFSRANGHYFTADFGVIHQCQCQVLITNSFQKIKVA